MWNVCVHPTEFNLPEAETAGWQVQSASCSSGLGAPGALGGAATLSAATTARIQALPLQQLEALAEALLEFTGSADLDAWLAAHD